MVDFWEKKFDVLVSTTIVESGIDISNANTLIVERGDNFGLSQLHQLRGRVGRGRERGYAYFLYPPEKPLTETAHERLATIAQHTEMGAGMYVAMKDLEIRGAGNLLGGEQSGHIAGVGFDLYIRMVGEAVADYRTALEEGGGEEEAAAGGQDRAARSTRTCRTTTRRASGCACRRTGRSPPPTPRRTSRPYARNSPTATASCPSRWRTCCWSPGCGMLARGLRRRRHHPAGQQRPLRAGGVARVAGAAAQAPLPAHGHQAPARPDPGAAPDRGRIGGKPVVGRELLAWTGEFLTTILGS